VLFRSVGLTLETTREDFARAILEGLVFEIGMNVSIIENETGNISKKLLVSGGLSRMTLYNQMIADFTGKEICVTEDNEATVTGAWISAQLALKCVRSVEEGATMALKNRVCTICRPIPDGVRFFESAKAKRDSLYQGLYEKNFE
jgi:sugar (pentulose or hexulose) kinase